MFILYAIPIGIAVGLLLGGRMEHLAELRFRWAGLAVLGLVVQLLLFVGPVSGLVGDAGPVIYAASTAAVFVAVLRNLRIPGMALVAVGAGSNLAAIVANGGVMPASPEAVAAVGLQEGDGFTNSAVVADPVLRPLTDIFALPSWLPLANVFSLGDVLLGVGVAVVIAAAMRRTPTPAAATATGDAS